MLKVLDAKKTPRDLGWLATRNALRHYFYYAYNFSFLQVIKIE